MSPEDLTPAEQQATMAAGEQAAYTQLAGSPAALADPLAEEQWLPEAEELPRRPRRRLLTPLPLALVALLLAALGFIGGVLVEKGQGPSGSSAATGAAASGFASRRRAAAGAGAGAAGGSVGARSGSSAGGFARPTVGTVAYLEGSTLYVTNSEGATVKVKTTPATGVTKSVKSAVSGIHPGESVTITGASGSNGAISAESITVGSSAGGFAGLFGGRSRSSGAAGTEQSLFGSG